MISWGLRYFPGSGDRTAVTVLAGPSGSDRREVGRLVLDAEEIEDLRGRLADAHHCDALCRDVEDERDRLFAELERMRPVVEAAQAMRETQRRDVISRPITTHDLFARVEAFGSIREAFVAAVDTYEEQERGTDE